MTQTHDSHSIYPVNAKELISILSDYSPEAEVLAHWEGQEIPFSEKDIELEFNKIVIDVDNTNHGSMEERLCNRAKKDKTSFHYGRVKPIDWLKGDK